MQIGKHDLREIIHNLNEINAFFQDLNETKHSDILHSYPWSSDYHKTLEHASSILNNYDRFLSLNKSFLDDLLNWEPEDEEIDWYEKVNMIKIDAVEVRVDKDNNLYYDICPECNKKLGEADAYGHDCE